MSDDLIKTSLTVLEDHGVDAKDVVVIEVPEGVPEGAIMITIWPHYLSVAKVKHVRDGIVYALAII